MVTPGGVEESTSVEKCWCVSRSHLGGHLERVTHLRCEAEDVAQGLLSLAEDITRAVKVLPAFLDARNAPNLLNIVLGCTFFI